MCVHTANDIWVQYSASGCILRNMNGKVDERVSEVAKLSEFAAMKLQASYAAFMFGLKHRWTKFLRTLQEIEDLLIPLERAVADFLIPSNTWHTCTREEKDLLALPVRMGGVRLIEPSQVATFEYESSVKVAKHPCLNIKLSQVYGTTNNTT